MHLKQLKLAGFKSFVEPTVIHFPSQLVGVVGPNGCGKSNVIDAVRWVMGESSAKNLRGDSMVDVIFNGSSQRKAVGQASVELVFDNSLGRLTGQYASYQAISVKRLVTRESESFYFLNGTRCRRRDITDIFLGTGAGTRGYSIIGQGTISRLIEARPEELRVFLEEAAGISKYKERRRETAIRITHTRENLARVADIRDELAKQLQRLEKQATVANRYQQLKKEEKHCRITILILKWQMVEQEKKILAQELQIKTVDDEKIRAAITHLHCQISLLRNQWEDDNNSLNTIQTQCYQLTTEIALLKENLEQYRRENQRLSTEKQQLQAEWQLLASQIQDEQCILKDTKLDHQNAEKALLQLMQSEKDTLTIVQGFQDEQKQWQSAWESIRNGLNKASGDEQIEQVRLNHLEQQQQDYLIRIEKNQKELEQLDDELISLQTDKLESTLITLSQTLHKEQGHYNELQTVIAQTRLESQTVESQLQNHQTQLDQLKTEKATLIGLINATLEVSQLATNELVDYPRLLDSLVVDEQWQRACETILGRQLQAFLVEAIEPCLPLLSNSSSLITEDDKQSTPALYPRLSDKIQGLIPYCTPRMETIFTAASFEQACEWLPFINDEQSIISPDGSWVSKKWLRQAPVNLSEEGLLAKKQSLITIEKLIEDAHAVVVTLKTKHHELINFLEQKNQTVSSLQQTLLETQGNIKSYELEIAAKQRLVKQTLLKKSHLLEENNELIVRREEKILQHEKLEDVLTSTRMTRLSFEVKNKEALAAKEHWESNLLSSQAFLEKIKVELHHSQRQVERYQLIGQQSSKNISQAQTKTLFLSDKLELINEQLIQLTAENPSLVASLNDKLLQHNGLELTVTKKQEQLNDIHANLEKQDVLLKTYEKEGKISQELQIQQQLKLQTFLVQADNLMHQLQELKVANADSFAEMIVDKNSLNYEKNLLDIVDKIKRLGAINLAAIEEYTQESARKALLDEQYNDLIEALTTLDAAIEKMDKETTQRLRLTFNQVNKAFQTLFPRLFGGGRALLELTSDNLLEAGVIVMAEPPGKRNSTIHLLSGGEKAMTAVALVFAFFQLNPSPFCLLDEVDAPLDDVNVERFCSLVKEMSQLVQFLFITHNKVTMGLAEHLIGVTMQEPGISRIVSVNVDEALALTENNE